MDQKNSLKQVYIITDGGKLLYRKDFIGGGLSPEIIAGFLSAFSSFFREAFKSEPRELLISDRKVFFKKLNDDVIAVILADAKTSVNDFKQFFQIISREFAENIRDLNLTGNIEVDRKIEDVIADTLRKNRARVVRVKPPSIEEFKFILLKIRKGLPSFIRAINIGKRLTVLGDLEEVRKTVSALRFISYFKHGLKIVEYSPKFKEADVIGLPLSEKNLIPSDYCILDLSTGVFSPDISSKSYDNMFKKLKPPFDERILKYLVDYFENLPEMKKAFLNFLRKGKISEAEKLLGTYTPDEKEIFLDHVISNDGVLRALREYSKYIQVDVLKTFNPNLIVLDNKVFYKNKLSVEESLKLMKELYSNALDYLSESKVKQLQKNLKETLF